MASTSVDLGRLDLVSTTSGMQLQLSSSAQLAPSAEDAQCENQKLIAHAPGPDLGFQSWTYGSSSYRLVLKLHIDEGFPAPFRHKMSDAVADVICTAALWEQLSFVPKSVERSSSDTTEADIVTIHFGYNEGSSGKQKRIHRLNKDVPFCDVKPPPGVQSQALEAVNFTIKLSPPPKRKRRRVCRTALSDASVLTHPNQCAVGKPATHALFGKCTDQVFGVEAEGTSHVPLRYAQAVPSDLDDCLLHDFEDETMLTEEAMPVGELAGHSMMSVETDTQRLLIQKRSSSTHDTLVNEEDEPRIDDVICLVDAAFRLAISDSPRRIGKGVRISSKESFMRLVELAPSLWAPGYLPAVSSRAVFLLTIGHALTKVGSKGQSNALRSNVAKLAQPSCAAELEGKSHDSLEKCLSTRLWCLLQRGCYDRNAAASLKPLCRSGIVPQDGGYSNDELLDRNHVLEIPDHLDLVFNEDLDFYSSDPVSDDDLFDTLPSGKIEVPKDSEFSFWDEEETTVPVVRHRRGADGSALTSDAAMLLGDQCNENMALEDQEHVEEDLLSVCGSNSTSLPAEREGRRFTRENEDIARQESHYTAEFVFCHDELLCI